MRTYRGNSVSVLHPDLLYDLKTLRLFGELYCSVGVILFVGRVV